MDQEQRDLVERQKVLLENMGRIRVMRRGTLSQQSYAQRQERRGGQGACGPYFVWQGYVEGRRFGMRVGANDVETMREEIEARQRFERLCAEYIATGEALAERQRQRAGSEDRLKRGLKSRSNRARRSRG